LFFFFSPPLCSQHLEQCWAQGRTQETLAEQMRKLTANSRYVGPSSSPHSLATWISASLDLGH
jgi:hypothetical protein